MPSSHPADFKNLTKNTVNLPIASPAPNRYHQGVGHAVTDFLISVDFVARADRAGCGK